MAEIMDSVASKVGELHIDKIDTITTVCGGKIGPREVCETCSKMEF
jgi:hypothetical protein